VKLKKVVTGIMIYIGKKVMGKLFAGILIASILVGILTVIPEKTRAEVWNIETVDSAGDVGEYTSIAIDNNGYSHISYYDSTNRHLKYARWTGTAWSIKTVDSSIGIVGRYTSIALDSNGYPHISYDSTRDLKYAKWTGTAWNITTVDSAGFFLARTHQ